MDILKVVDGLKNSKQTKLVALIAKAKLEEIIQAGYKPDGSDAEKMTMFLLAIGELQGMDLAAAFSEKIDERTAVEEKPAMGFCDFKKAA